MYKAITGIAVALSLLAAASPASAQWRGHHGGGHYGGYHRGGGGYGIGAGLATGLIVGGALAAANRGYYDDGYYAQAPYAGGGNVEYCLQRYRSYDPASGTYLGFDGRRHPC
jgi:hypothetical protein